MAFKPTKPKEASEIIEEQAAQWFYTTWLLWRRTYNVDTASFPEFKDLTSAQQAFAKLVMTSALHILDEDRIRMRKEGSE